MRDWGFGDAGPVRRLAPPPLHPQRLKVTLHRFAANYERTPEKTLNLLDDPYDSSYSKEKTFFSGGGGLISTTADYARFCEMLLRGGGLGFAKTLGRVEAGSIAAGDYYWGGAASTIFWVDPVEDLYAICMTELMPSNTFNLRGQLKNLIYSAIVEQQRRARIRAPSGRGRYEPLTRRPKHPRLRSLREEMGRPPRFGH